MKDQEDALWEAIGGSVPETKMMPTVIEKRSQRRRLERTAALPPAGEKTAFEKSHPKVAEWLMAYKGSFPFYLSLKSQYEMRGDLSEKQVEAVYRAIEREGGQVTDRPVATADVLKVLTAVRQAQAENMNDPKAMLSMIDAAIAMHTPKVEKKVFTLAVGERVRVSKFFAKKTGESCGLKRAHFVYEILDVMNETAKAYQVKVRAVSQRSGHCCVCGLRLDNPESVTKGIGPICGGWYELNWNSDKDILNSLAEKLMTLSTEVEIWIPKSVIKERFTK